MPRLGTFMAGLLAGASTLTGVAYAQGGSTAAPVANEVVGLEEVVVTAQRVEETAQRAAIAISVVQPEALANVTSPTEFGKLVPALQFSSAAGSAPILYVRGVGTFSSNPYTDSAVAVNYDGVYIGRPTSVTGLFYDLERIEVLKGPQGTLYGRNATAGALNIIPAKPRIGERSLDLQVSAGNYDSVNLQAAGNIAISDTTALRLSAISYQRDGYNSDGTYSDEGVGGRAQVLFQPTDDLSLRVSADYFNLGGTGPVMSLLGQSAFPGGPVVSFGLTPDVGPSDPRSLTLLNTRIFSSTAGAPFGPPLAQPDIDNKYYGVNAELNWDLGFGALTVLPAFRKADLDMLSYPAMFMITTDEQDEQGSIEARLSGETGAFRWIGGVYYIDETVKARYLVSQPYFGAAQFFEAENKSAAVFGRLTWNVTDNFRLTGAARYTADDKSFEGIAYTAVAVCTAPTHQCPAARPLGLQTGNRDADLAGIGYVRPPGFPVYVDVAGASGIIWAPGEIPVNASTETTKTTYRVAAEYEPREGSLVYASFETGYRGGGFSFSTIKPTYEPETIDAYTIGAKNRFFDNRLQLNVEAFHWTYKDQQVAHSSIGRTGGQEFATENIGQSTNKGIEVELTALPMENTRLMAVVQYLDAKNDSFVYREVDTSANAGLPPGSIRPNVNCPSTYDGAGGFNVDCSGLRALRAPEWSINLGIQQTFDVSENYKLMLEANTHYQTESIVMFERLTFSQLDSYWQTDMGATIGPKDDRWALTAYVNNVEDERIRLNPGVDPLSGAYTGIFGAPRTYGLRLKMHLGS